jgi:predicted transcriptional regulator
MATLTVRLPVRLRRELEKLSKERGRPAGEIVRESLRRYLAVERFRALRGKALPFAEAEGFLSDEDVFKAIS